MLYDYFKIKHPKSILVYIEEFNKLERTIICDFIDSNELFELKTFFNEEGKISEASMILIENYTGKPVQENTIYALDSKALSELKERNLINQYLDSYLIG